MIPKPFEEIDRAALEALIENGVSESKTIEYKSKMRERVEEFVADVSAFANTAGGDLIIGVEEDKGVPTGFPGVEIDDPDGECLRLDQMLQNGLEPRLPRVDIKSIQVSEGRYVLVIRTHKSWNSPHRVKKNRKFHIRKSAGRDELDVGELRSAFTLSEVVADRIRNFRTDRIAKIYSRGTGHETPVPLEPGGCMVLHIIPRSAFTEGAMINIADYKTSSNLLPSLGAKKDTMGARVNLDGVATIEEVYEKPVRTYAQVFRTGVVESVALLKTDHEKSLGIPEGQMILHSKIYEQETINFLTHYLKFATEFEIVPPYYVFLSFIGLQDVNLVVLEGEIQKKQKMERIAETREIRQGGLLVPFKGKMMMLPEVVIEEQDAPLSQSLRPLFDMVWNAFGYIRSFNYDEQGNWID